MVCINTNVSLENYGIEQYSLTHIIENNTLVDMQYIDKIRNINMYSDQLTMVIIDRGHIKKKKCIWYNKTRNELFNEYTPPIIRGYYDATIKDEYTYSIEFTVMNKKIVLEFDKNTVTVFTPHSNMIFVYKADDSGILIKNSLVESYYLLDNGFIYNDHNSLTSILYYNGFKNSVACSLLPIKHTGSLILDILPYKVISDKETYNIEYDKNGIICKCSNSNGMNLCIYTTVGEKNIISTHPLFIDPFDISYNDTPLEYWAKDYFILAEDSIILKREVYKATNSYDLLNLINA